MDVGAAGGSKLVDPIADFSSEDCEDEDSGRTIAVTTVFEMIGQDKDLEVARNNAGGEVVSPETPPNDTAQVVAATAIFNKNTALFFVLMVPSNMLFGVLLMITVVVVVVLMICWL